ncbi:MULTISPECIES: CHY zinc finger protein [Microbacterium]|uniref:CHY zinc finger protein n=1 Tax=Microbacterium TaxID=33882 RepID=UPI00217D62E4|nr:MULTISPECIES: CHY zinc finger protein [Microbacterium]UWF76631.1 hypothetical protein JSY13_07015 [Microbacterium neungamense]WCM54780.1 hypothetical protein JRG78_07015 [Microbacterium sp. EF45047]
MSEVQVSEVCVGGVLVRGREVDPQTRCAHYRAAHDVVAIRFACCGDWYPCLHCHAEAARHPLLPWTQADAGVEAALCGVCGERMRIAAYRAAAACPACGTAFNPGCVRHHPLYFG